MHPSPRASELSLSGPFPWTSTTLLVFSQEVSLQSIPHCLCPSWRHSLSQTAGDREHSMENAYLYSPLRPGEVRTLVLHSGRQDDPLVAHFEHVQMKCRSFDECSERSNLIRREKLPPEALRTSQGYDAIPYAWGSPKRCHTLHIDGRGGIGLTESLFGALRRFRSPIERRRL